MRIAIHDYGGYSFSVQLARELAGRGNDLLYLYGESTQLVKRGDFRKRFGDPNGLEIAGITLLEKFEKYSFARRRLQEIEYGTTLSKTVRHFNPDVIISANTPLDAQRILLKESKKQGRRFIFWLQDVIGLATFRALRKRSTLLASVVGGYYQRLERKLAGQSDATVLISDDFCPLMTEWGIAPQRITIIPNWAPLDQLVPKPRRNIWSIKQGLADNFCFLYSGVLGMKHNPELLLRLALQYKTEENVRVVVVSQGPGAEWLQRKRDELRLKNLLIYDFQPFETYPDVLGAADVLVVLLDEEAGVYSVPSKVYTYFCARRPLLLSIPSRNLAARIVDDCRAGIGVPPGKVEEFLQAADDLKYNKLLRDEFAENAIAYARKRFDIKRIGDSFEEVILKTFQ